MHFLVAFFPGLHKGQLDQEVVKRSLQLFVFCIPKFGLLEFGAQNRN